MQIRIYLDIYQEHMEKGQRSYSLLLARKKVKGHISKVGKHIAQELSYTNTINIGDNQLDNV